MAKKRKSKLGKKKRTSKKRKTMSLKLPALSTLVKLPKKQLAAGANRYGKALEIKSEGTQMYYSSGKRRAIGPALPKGFKRKRSRSKKAQTLPPEIAHIFD